MKNSEATWIETVLAGDVDAYGSLVKRYHKSVYAAAWSVVRDSTIAEDIAQEAFITSFVRLSQLRDPSAFAAWLADSRVTDTMAAKSRVRWMVICGLLVSAWG